MELVHSRLSKEDIRKIGKEQGLEGDTLSMFVKFMSIRFPNEGHGPYVAEWAQRFRKGRSYAWGHADAKTRKVLLEVGYGWNDKWNDGKFRKKRKAKTKLSQFDTRRIFR